MKLTIPRVVALLGLAALTLGACGSSPDAGGARSDTAGKRSVVVSFYPLELAAQRIGGDLVTVRSLTKPGAEPHDVELGAQDLAHLLEADVVIYSRGFQPAVDAGVDQASPAKVLEVSRTARLTLAATHEAASPGELSGTEPQGNDPHFWLDPMRYADVAKAIGARLAAVDPTHAATYEANTTAFVDELTALDHEFSTGLANCRITTLVTSHAAFGYLAQRYGLVQHGISGLSPEVEPTASQLKAVSDLVRAKGVTTIYQETMVEPEFAQTVAAATGARLATLDPLEGITSESAGRDYFEVMRNNLQTLKQGQECS